MSFQNTLYFDIEIFDIDTFGDLRYHFNIKAIGEDDGYPLRGH